MKCPICIKEVSSDQSQQWGPECAHVDCVNAFNAGRSVLNTELTEANDYINRLEEAGDALSKTQTYDLLENTNWRKAKEAKP